LRAHQVDGSCLERMRAIPDRLNLSVRRVFLFPFFFVMKQKKKLSNKQKL
jgi:hypothetical protein